MVLSARTLQIIWIASFATGMLFFVLSHRYSQSDIDVFPTSPEAWLFFLLGWSFVVVAAVSAGFYMKRRTSAMPRTTTKGHTEMCQISSAAGGVLGYPVSRLGYPVVLFRLYFGLIITLPFFMFLAVMAKS